MLVVIHSHNLKIKSVQQVNGDETDARNLAKDLAEKEIGAPLSDEAIAELEETNQAHFWRGCSFCGLEHCSFTVANVTV